MNNNKTLSNRRHFVDTRWRSLSLDPRRSIERTSSGAVTSLSIEGDGRFLLSGGSDSRIRIFDLQNTRCKNTLEQANQVAVSPQDKKLGHKFSVTGVSWYPHDAGLFTSSSSDKTVKVWDANVMQPACTFNLKEKVYVHTLSPVSSVYSLIAAGTESSYVRLCDMRSGGCAQMLSGHTKQVTSLAWSNQNEFILASGSADNSIRIWDIRKSNSCLTKLLPPPEPPSTNPLQKPVVISLAFTPTDAYLVSVNMGATYDVWSVTENNETSSASLTHYARHPIPDTNFLGMETNSVGVDVGWGGRVGKEVLLVPGVGSGGGRGVGVFEVCSGKRVTVLKGHFGRCICVRVRKGLAGEVVSGGGDGEVLVWTPRDTLEGDFEDYWSE
ncbi:WD40 repeat-like protein [Rhizoclosmatium globosum]|uniref:WD40 repeat-like protein n=1 Tax=Rhizoclosmatium globosum TaxID=329046 RepID=A0A1Y2CX35_9FUNG|nr:WD40 repeat-like protein [Rhizoclosmatium globosum]|eukprot:ORY51593.1 WD40 repeat-like protein [Rhizoclosmatium globosum]